ncbi:L,D-transpeptidase family protein [Algicola sagamiensis]|uniref:L,D-transpeptidase family protein n=1 Tax=Algicola sagamiensis TaxID=163869 RepID=UPI000375A1D9|nr:L,D-transpeptidase family protein [Algicola sagamiensis]
MKKQCLMVGVLMTLSQSVMAQVNLVKVDKSERKMYLLESGKVLRTYHITLGENPKGHKQQEGDEKTPEGTYTLDYKKEDSAYYRSMHISYPNKQDRLAAKKRGVSPGGFIMIHGQKNGFGYLASVTQKYDWTDGCIAITNEEMDEFMALVEVGTKIQIEW